MRRTLLSRLGDAATKVESWLALGTYVVGTGAFAWLVTQWGWLSSQGWAAVLTVAIFGAASIAIAICLIYLSIALIRGGGAVTKRDSSEPKSHTSADILELLRKNHRDAQLEMVTRKTFSNVHVLLDGKHFIGCIFDGCTVEYNGGPVHFNECKLKDGTVRFLSRNPSILQAMTILRAARFFRTDSHAATFPIEQVDMIDLPTIVEIPPPNSQDSEKGTP